MLNDILTGKATLESPPAAEGPYRQPTTPQTTHRCVQCSEAYTAPADVAPGVCMGCRLAASAASQDSIRRSQEGYRRAEASHRMLKAVAFGVVVLVLGVFRWQMREQRRDDAAEAAGYRDYEHYLTEQEQARAQPSDMFSWRVDELANEMCRCVDLACARDVRARYEHHVAYGAPSDDASRDAVRASATRLSECQLRHEQR